MAAGQQRGVLLRGRLEAQGLEPAVPLPLRPHPGPRQHKEPVQLDLFIPHETGYDFKVIVTNKTLAAGNTVLFHEGRGSQEGILGELKAHCQMDYVPVTPPDRQPALPPGRTLRPQPGPRTPDGHHPTLSTDHRSAPRALGLRETRHLAQHPAPPRRPAHPPSRHPDAHPQCQRLAPSATPRPPQNLADAPKAA